MSEQCLLGIKYCSDSIGTAGSSLNRNAFGLYTGWIYSKSKGLYLTGSYFPSVTYGTQKKGTGYQYDIGYRFDSGNGTVCLAPHIRILF